MSKITIKSIAEVKPYSGEGAIPGIRFKAMRQELGVSAWGMNVIEIDPHNEGYPEHDHVEDGQEEVYLIVSGSASLVLPDGSHPVSEGQMIRVEPSLKRKFVTQQSAVVILAIGAKPGEAYTPPAWG
ncbi:MAG: hypothetical protein AAFQ82_06900 [Myxococcota bacterium]